MKGCTTLSIKLKSDFIKKVFLLVFLVFVFVGCTQLGVKDCGTDLECFIESMENREKAKVSYDKGLSIDNSFDRCPYSQLGAGKDVTAGSGEAEIVKYDELTA